MDENNVFEMRRALKLPTLLGKLLALLVTERYVTTAMIEQDHALTKKAKVAIRRLRAKLEVHGITIQSMRDMGYWLDPEDKEKVLASIGLPAVAAEPELAAESGEPVAPAEPIE